MIIRGKGGGGGGAKHRVLLEWFTPVMVSLLGPDKEPGWEGSSGRGGGGGGCCELLANVCWFGEKTQARAPSHGSWS